MQTFLELDRRVKKIAREDALCRRFMGIPGVGEITALSFKAAVDDPARFKSSRTVGAHFGLTPRRFQSGEKDNPGRISHAGDADVRATLYAAANDLCLPSLDAHWKAGQRGGAALWRKLRGEGFRGSLRVVGEWASGRPAVGAPTRRTLSA